MIRLIHPASRRALTINTELATRNERAGNGQNLLGEHRNIKRLRDHSAVREHVEQRLVARLNGRNAGCAGEDGGIGDEVSGTNVRVHAGVLDNAGGRDHGGDGLKRTGEVKHAGGERGGAKGLQDGLQAV